MLEGNATQHITSLHRVHRRARGTLRVCGRSGRFATLSLLAHIRTCGEEQLLTNAKITRIVAQRGVQCQNVSLTNAETHSQSGHRVSCCHRVFHQCRTHRFPLRSSFNGSFSRSSSFCRRHLRKRFFIHSGFHLLFFSHRHFRGFHLRLLRGDLLLRSATSENGRRSGGQTYCKQGLLLHLKLHKDNLSECPLTPLMITQSATRKQAEDY